MKYTIEEIHERIETFSNLAGLFADEEMPTPELAMLVHDINTAYDRQIEAEERLVELVEKMMKRKKRGSS